MKKYNLETKILFKPEEEGINNIINIIKHFGEIYLENYKKYAFRNCPSKEPEKRTFIISGDKSNIWTNIGVSNKFVGTIFINELDKSIDEHIWKIRILKTKNKEIMSVVAFIDFDLNSIDHYKTCGWYYYCYDSKLFSGPHFNYSISNIQTG